jgi:hypothetical protein
VPSFSAVGDLNFEMRLNPFNLNLELILFSFAMQFSTAVSSWLNDNPNYGQFAFQFLFAADALAIENFKYSFQDKCILEHLKLYFKYNFLDISYLCSRCQEDGLLYHACCWFSMHVWSGPGQVIVSGRQVWPEASRTVQIFPSKKCEGAKQPTKLVTFQSVAMIHLPARISRDWRLQLLGVGHHQV